MLKRDGAGIMALLNEALALSGRDAQAKIAELIPRLDEANRECAEVVRLLDDLSNLDLQQRQELAQRIRRFWYVAIYEEA